MAAAILSLGLVATAVTPAQAQWGSGTANCGSSWSFTRANSTARLYHLHETSGMKGGDDYAAGISSHREFWKPGSVYMTLDTSGNYSGAVFGCSA